MRCVFVKFEVASRDGLSRPSEILTEVAGICWEWASSITDGSNDPFPKKWELGDYSSISTKKRRNYTAKISDMGHGDERLWELVFSDLDLETKTVWKNTLHLLISNQKLEFSCLQEVRFENPHINAFKEKIGPPRLIRMIMSQRSLICIDPNHSPLTFEPKQTMNGEDIFEQIVDEKRQIPIILMSKSFKEKKCLIYPAKLANRLSGLANVIVVRNLNTKTFNEPLGKQWVSNGSIRIYWPGLSPMDLLENENYDSLYTKNRFSLLFGSNEKNFCDHIVDEISRASGMSFVPNRIASEIRREYIELEAEREAEVLANELRNRYSTKQESLDSQLSELRQKFSSQSTELRTSRREREYQIEKVTQAENKCLTLEAKIAKLEQEVRPLRQLEYLMQEVKGKNPSLEPLDFENAWRNLAQTEEEIELEPDEETFTSISEAVAKAKDDFGRYVIILDDAISSAKKTNSDADPKDVYEFFKWLYDKLKNKHQLTHKSFKEEFVGKYAEMESGETISRHKKEFNSKSRKFKLSVDGMLKHKNHALIELLPHMKFGSKSNPLRVHFRVIGNIGEISKIWIKKGTNWYRETGKESKNNFIPNPPVAIVGWIGDHLPI